MSGIQEDLFEFIQTLSVSEKRYFKVFASDSSASDANNYVVLFDVLCSLDRYDEPRLIQHLQRKLKGIPDKNFAGQLNQDMHYLYKVLLQALHQYKNKAAHIQIRNMISEATLLRDRGLYKQAEKRIWKAKDLAKKYHNYVALLELNRLERTLTWSLNAPNEEEKIQSLIAEKNEIMRVLDEEMAYEDLYARVSSALNRQNMLNINDEKAAELSAQIEAMFSRKEPQQLSAFAELRRHQIGALYASAQTPSERNHDKIDQLLEWWKTHAYLQEEEFFRYQISLSTLLTFFFNNEELEKMMDLIRKIKERDTEKTRGNALVFRFTIIMHELLYYLNMGKIDEAKQLLPHIREGISRYTHSVKRKITICYNAAVVCFFDGDYRFCEEWLSKVLAYANHNLRKDLMRKAFLIRILLLEEGADGLQDKAIRVAKNYFREEESPENSKTSSKVRRIEQEILALIIKIMRTPSLHRERKEPLQKMLQYLESVNTSPESRRLNGVDEFLVWCQSKLGRKSIREVFIATLPPRK